MDLIFIFRSIQSGDLCMWARISSSFLGVEKASVQQLAHTHTPPQGMDDRGLTRGGTAQVVPPPPPVQCRPLDPIQLFQILFSHAFRIIVWLSIGWCEMSEPKGGVCVCMGSPGYLLPHDHSSVSLFGYFLASSMSITRHRTKQQIKT